MAGIVRELQKEAMDSSVRISDLLRKALLVARKLNVPEMERWINSELNGYESKVPDYRYGERRDQGLESLRRHLDADDV